jgi:hypothetical protein
MSKAFGAAAVIVLSIMPIAVSSSAGASSPVAGRSLDGTPGADAARATSVTAPDAPMKVVASAGSYALKVARTTSASTGASIHAHSVTPEAPSPTATAATTTTTTVPTATTTTTVPTVPTTSNPSLVVPLYDSSYVDWASTCSSLSSTNSFVVADIGDPGGPGTSADPNWAANLRACDNAHVGVLGYVDSGYCQVPIATVESQIDSWYDFYASSGVVGIFVDEADNPYSPKSPSDCLSGTTSAVTYYQTISAYVHEEGVNQTVTLNFGDNPTSDWALSSGVAAQNADILVIFESPYGQYVDYANTGEPWSTVPWESTYAASHFSILVYDAPDANPGTFCSAVSQQSVGFAYATPNSGWLTPPTSVYLTDELHGC